MMRSAHHLQETSTRYVGWCPICERDIKVRTGLVHHGYERPGVGFIIGDCPGVGNPPYETSTHACDFYLRVFAIPKIREAENVLAILNSPEGPPYLTFEKYDIATRRVPRDRYGNPEMIDLSRDQADEFEAQLPGYDKDRYLWERRLRAAISNTESKLKHWERENKNSAALADIYGSQKLREISGYRITRDQAVQMLDRDAVWNAFGLLNADNATIMKRLDEMKWGQKVPNESPRGSYRVSLQWPASLGGGIAKTRGF